MISFTNVSKVYAKQAVLDILLLEIPKGQTFGLVGNNGAGKTTMFSCLLDLIKPSKGVVKNNNVNVRESEDWKSFTSAYLDESFLIGYLMPEEYFYFIGELRGVSKREVDRFLNQFEDIFIYIDKERSLTKYQKKVYRNLTIMIKHIQVSNLTQEKLQKLILEYRDIIESSSDFLNQKIKLEKIIEH